MPILQAICKVSPSELNTNTIKVPILKSEKGGLFLDEGDALTIPVV